MVLVIGGNCQGKLTFTMRELAGQPFSETLCADGAKDDFAAAAERPVVSHFHEYIRRLVSEGKDTESFLEQVIGGKAQYVIMDEIGCGVVPIDKNDREYREAAGRAGQYMAAHAKEVYRVFCGIGVKIKG